jgi:hypothetical protein
VAKTADEKKVVDALDNFEKPLILFRTPAADEMVSATENKIEDLKVEEGDLENKQREAESRGSTNLVPFIQKRGEARIEIAKQELVRARRILEINKRNRLASEMARDEEARGRDGVVLLLRNLLRQKETETRDAR